MRKPNWDKPITAEELKRAKANIRTLLARLSPDGLLEAEATIKQLVYAYPKGGHTDV